MQALRRSVMPALGCLAVLAASALAAQDPAPAVRRAFTPLAERMAERASAFLAALDDGQRAAAAARFDDPERRTWEFGPVRRDGIVLGALSADEFSRLESLLDTVLTEAGMDAWHQIRGLESELRRRESTPEKPATHRNPDLYWLRVYGTPGADSAWSWRFEGHHIALHVTCVPGQTPTVTPFFLGASPMFVDDPATETDELVPSVDAFVALHDDVRAFLSALSDAEAASTAPGTDRPGDIRMGPRVDTLPAAMGLDARSLDAAPLAKLAQVLDRYQSYLEPTLRGFSLRDGLMTDGEVGIHFAHWGPAEIDAERAWALRAPSFVLEFATTTGPDHVHAVLRDTERDFGGPPR